MTVTARQNHTQQLDFIRYDFAFNTVGATAIQQSMRSALPAGAIVSQIQVSVPVLFNGTTATVDVGTASAPTALVSAGSLTAVASTITSPATLAGLVSSSADTELFVRYNFTGTATAGQASVIVFFTPNI